MYDDFWSGMNYGQPVQRPSVNPQPRTQQGYTTTQRRTSDKVIQIRKPSEYDKRPQIYMTNDYNDTAELWANGDVFIKKTNGEVDKMRFPSRPFCNKNIDC